MQTTNDFQIHIGCRQLFLMSLIPLPEMGGRIQKIFSTVNQKSH